jgi:hypothetical protein
MTEDEIVDELAKEPFEPFRIHMVSGKVIDVLNPNAAHTLARSLLVLRNPITGTPRAEGYDVIAYENIERLEQLRIGRHPGKKRKPA